MYGVLVRYIRCTVVLFVYSYGIYGGLEVFLIRIITKKFLCSWYGIYGTMENAQAYYIILHIIIYYTIARLIYHNTIAGDRFQRLVMKLIDSLD